MVAFRSAKVRLRGALSRSERRHFLATPTPFVYSGHATRNAISERRVARTALPVDEQSRYPHWLH